MTYDNETLKRLQKVQIGILKDFIKVCNKYDLGYFLVYGTALGAERHNGFIPWDDDLDVGMLREEYEKFMKIIDLEMGEKYKVLTTDIDPRYACTVTHLQKKKTKFISYYSKDLKCDLCIDIDIFVFDNVADDDKKRKKQLMETWFWGRLLFLRGTPYPIITLKGIIGILAKVICWIVHYAMIILGISTSFIYKKFLKASTKFNEIDTEYVTCFEDPAAKSSIIKKKNLKQLKTANFENMLVKVPNNNHDYLTQIYGDYMIIPPKEQQVNHYPYLIEFGDDN